MTTPSEKHWVDAVRVDPDYNSMHEFESDGVTSQFEVNFSGGYLNVTHVKAYQTDPETGFSEDLTLTRVGESLFQVSPVPPKGFTITIWRDTPKDVPLLDFTDGAMITAENLDRNAKQAVFGVAEMVDRFLLTNTQTEQALEIAQEARETAKDANATANSALEEVTHTLRTPLSEPAPKSLPDREARKNTVLAFDKDGEPSVTVPASGSAADVLLKLAEDDGATRVGYGDSTVAAKLHALDGDIAEVSGHLNDWQLPGAADKIPMLPGGTVQDALNAITPEMFGAVGDGVADDSAAVNSALAYAYSSQKYRVVGAGRYKVSSPIKVDNFGQGLQLHLQCVIAADDFPTTSDWKTANGMIEIGSESNGSQVGLDIRVGFAHGKDKATLFKLIKHGAGGSTFSAGRVQNCIGVVDITNSNVSNSNSNIIYGEYWLNGLYGIRLRGAAPRVVEGTKIQVGFMTGMRYGGIQLFSGSQYFHIMGTGLDFCGRNLTQLTLNAMPPVTVRETPLSAASGDFEVLDVYQFQGKGSVLVIEPQSSENGSKSFAVGQTVTVGGAEYTISEVTTSVTARAYFDFIHGFQGTPFSRGTAHFDYLSRYVGGNFNALTISWGNSFSEINHSINNIWFRQQGIAVSINDRNTGKQLANWDTTGAGNLTIPGGLTTGNGNLTVNGVSAFNGHLYHGGYRTYGSEYSLPLPRNATTNVRTFHFVGDGTVKTTKEAYKVYVSGPTGLNGVGGEAYVMVGSSGIEVQAGSVTGVALSASGYTLRAIQNSQESMNLTFMFERKM